MHPMSRQEWREFALAGTKTGKIAVTKLNGTPHVTPVWFLLDEENEDDIVVFTTGVKSVKGRALKRDSRFALSIDDQEPPYSFVIIEATATLSEDPTDLLDWATRLAERYIGAEQAEEYGRRNAVPGEYLVRGKVIKVFAAAEISR